MEHSNYTAELDGDDVIVVTDLCRGRSVTNDAEAVVAGLAGQFDMRARRVVYCDTAGRWDGMAVTCGRFTGFVMLGAASREEAVARARNRPLWRGETGA